METLKITISHPVGLHARPAAKFVQTASQFDASITVKNFSKGSEPVDAKSILRVLTLGVHHDDEVEITADGPDEKEAIEALRVLIEENFGEDET